MAHEAVIHGNQEIYAVLTSNYSTIQERPHSMRLITLRRNCAPQVCVLGWQSESYPFATGNENCESFAEASTHAPHKPLLLCEIPSWGRT
jgi:hypothetical protein